MSSLVSETNEYYKLELMSNDKVYQIECDLKNGASNFLENGMEYPVKSIKLGNNEYYKNKFRICKDNQYLGEVSFYSNENINNVKLNMLPQSESMLVENGNTVVENTPNYEESPFDTVLDKKIKSVFFNNFIDTSLRDEIKNNLN